MDQIFVLLLSAFTTVVAYIATVRGKPRLPVMHAIRAFIEYLGTFVLFVILNVTAGAAIILAVRGFTTRFVALYQLVSVMLLFLSGAQAFVFQLWWRRD